MKNCLIRFEFDFNKFATGKCGFALLIFNHYSHFTCIYNLFQFNKTQYYHIYLIAVISLSPLLDYKNRTFFVFCEQLS